MSKKLYKFFYDCGRMGYLDGLFVCKEEDIKSLVGKKLYFDEPLGKHSEVSFTFSDDEYEEIVLPEGVAEILEGEIGVSLSGFYPFDHCEELEEDE